MINLNYTINSDILNKISQIDEFKGEWKAIKQMEPDVLAHLKKVATIESIGSSNRIEGNKLSDKEIEKLLSNIQITSFKNRDEEEVGGYAEVSNLIFDDYEIIPLNENYIKQLHSILLKYSTKDSRHKGEYKTISNSVSAFDQNGNEIGIVFETATPFDTPRLMSELIQWTNHNLENRIIHPIIVIAIFIVHFLAIHPFQDGNGRLSRLLTNLLLLKCGYNYVMYSSLESIIEENKSSYYLALRKTQTTINADNPNYDNFIIFFINSMEKQKLSLEYKINQLKLNINTIDNEKQQSNNKLNASITINLNELPETAMNIYKLFENMDRVTIKYLKNNIEATESKIKRALALLQEKNLIKKYGVTNGCWYVKQ